MGPGDPCLPQNLGGCLSGTVGRVEVPKSVCELEAPASPWRTARMMRLVEMRIMGMLRMRMKMMGMMEMRMGMMRMLMMMGMMRRMWLLRMMRMIDEGDEDD